MAKHAILGLHHVTATVDDAQSDLDFAAGALGLRLLKKTVNFDNHNVYHFYYGNRSGTPGTLWTTFPYKGWGVPVGRKGAGQVHVTSFSVPADSLEFWEERLRASGTAVQSRQERFGEQAIAVSDSSGLNFELIGTESDSREPWTTSQIERAAAIRGLHSVTLQVHDPDPTIAFMTDLLGFRVVREMPGRMRLAVNGDEPGRFVDVAHDRGFVPAQNGVGTVHHVAMAIAEADEQLRLREDLLAQGCRVTPVMDRQYFQSIYFREPGNVLFEVATVKPGFAIDEDINHLGESLKLPPWEEPNRAAIERGLPKIDR